MIVASTGKPTKVAPRSLPVGRHMKSSVTGTFHFKFQLVWVSSIDCVRSGFCFSFTFALQTVVNVCRHDALQRSNYGMCQIMLTCYVIVIKPRSIVALEHSNYAKMPRYSSQTLPTRCVTAIKLCSCVTLR